VSQAPIFKSLEESIGVISQWNSEKQKIAFTNGCFDLLHKGHVDYLTKSASHGDKLIVGLNSDISIKKIKGKHRPIQSEISRAAILSSIKGIDMVVLFDEETPLKVIKAIRPDIIIKGGDYTVEEMIGREFVMEYGGKCEIIPFTKGYSTSDIIIKIKSLNFDDHLEK